MPNKLRVAMPSGTTASALPEPGAPARGHLQLHSETGGLTPWCGPAALALATGHSYADACALLRAVAPTGYPEGEVVTTYWRDLLAGLSAAGIPHVPLPVPSPHDTLLRMVRDDALAPGWYLLRVTDHFLLLRQLGAGLARLHDNHHTAMAVSGRLHGRRKVTHAAHLLGGPLVARDAISAVARHPVAGGRARRAARPASPAAGAGCRARGGSPGLSPRR